MVLNDILKLFPSNQVVSLSDENESQLPYGHRDKISDLHDIYKNREVLSMRIIYDVLYIRIMA